MYPGGAIGYQLFAIDPTLEEAIASWAAAGLGATTEVIASTATMPDWRPSEVRGADGWRVRVDVAPADPPRSGPGPAALLVPASAHERDAFGVQLVGLLTGRGFTVAATDIRGRGASRAPRSFDAFPPGQLANVRDDVGAALDLVAGEPAVDPARLVVFAEQDTADAAVAAAVADERVCALVLISARLAPDTLDAIGRRRPAVCGLVAKEDRLAMRSVTAAYRMSSAAHSRCACRGRRRAGHDDVRRLAVPASRAIYARAVAGGVVRRGDHAGRRRSTMSGSLRSPRCRRPSAPPSPASVSTTRSTTRRSPPSSGRSTSTACSCSPVNT